jgi:hypothetical protein
LPAIRCWVLAQCCRGCCRGSRAMSGPWGLLIERSKFEPVLGPTGVDVQMDQGVARFGPTVAGERAVALLEALGLRRDHPHRALPMQVVSTDLDYLSVSYASGLEQARICRPDFRFEALLQEVGAKFVYVLDLERPSGRNWDNIGRVEDVATGSAAGSAAGHLMRHQVPPGDKPLLLHQGQYPGGPARYGSGPSPRGGAGSAGPSRLWPRDVSRLRPLDTTSWICVVRRGVPIGVP